MDHVSDSTLIERCKGMDKDAFGILVRRYQKPAYAFAFSYLRNSDDAVTVSQEAFVRAWRAIDTFLAGKSFKPWLFSIVRNLALNLIEKKKSLREISLDSAMEDSGFDVPDKTADQLTEMEDSELKQKVWKAIFSLKDDFREIIILKHFNDLSYREISESLGIPAGTVMSRLYYARAELKEKLEPTVLGS